MSNGIRDDGRRASRLPDDPTARAAVERWVSSGPSASLFGNGLDFRGVDLSGMYIYEAWLYGSNFTRARLSEVDLPAGHLNEADFSGADLSSIVLSNAAADGARFTGAVLTNANLRSIEATGASFAASELTGSEIGGSLRDADLQRARMDEVRFLNLSLRGASLRQAVVNGARGTVIGPFLADVDDEERLIGGAEAEAWFAARGAEIEVLDVST